MRGADEKEKKKKKKKKKRRAAVEVTDFASTRCLLLARRSCSSRQRPTGHAEAAGGLEGMTKMMRAKWRKLTEKQRATAKKREAADRKRFDKWRLDKKTGEAAKLTFAQLYKMLYSSGARAPGE